MKDFKSKNICYACGYDAEDLVKQLAEKEKEIKDLIEWGYNERKNADAWKKDCYQAEQDKISFAVEQLEKVRIKFNCEDNYCYGDNNTIICVNKEIFNKTIDKQIKQLKEGK